MMLKGPDGETAHLPDVGRGPAPLARNTTGAGGQNKIYLTYPKADCIPLSAKRNFWSRVTVSTAYRVSIRTGEYAVFPHIHPIVYQDACGRSYAGGPTTAILARLDRGYARSRI